MWAFRASQYAQSRSYESHIASTLFLGFSGRHLLVVNALLFLVDGKLLLIFRCRFKILVLNERTVTVEGATKRIKGYTSVSPARRARSRKLRSSSTR